MASDKANIERILRKRGYTPLKRNRHIFWQKPGLDDIAMPQGSKMGMRWVNETLKRLWKERD